MTAGKLVKVDIHAAAFNVLINTFDMNLAPSGMSATISASISVSFTKDEESGLMCILSPLNELASFAYRIR